MPADRRLTGCAASDHPDPAAAVGEVVGRLQNSLAGSPQFSLVLVDEKIGSVLSTIAAVVHRLLGPDLMLAVAAPHVAGAEHLGPARASVAVWALCGIDVTAVDDDVTLDTAGSAARPALILSQRPDGTVISEFATSPDTPRPMFVTGDGRSWRPTVPKIAFPARSAEVVRGTGSRRIGTMMVATEAQGRTLSRLDHVPARAVLLDQLETTDPFVDGPSLEFPPLRATVRRSSEVGEQHETVDVIDVDHEHGSIELAAEVEVGDRIQLIAYDPSLAAQTVVDRVLGDGRRGDRGVLLDGDLAPSDTDEIGPVATATVQAGPSRAVGRTPWAEIRALLVLAADED